MHTRQRSTLVLSLNANLVYTHLGLKETNGPEVGAKSTFTSTYGLTPFLASLSPTSRLT